MREALAAVLVAAVVLTGCSGGDASRSADPPSTSPTASATPTPTPLPTQTATSLPPPEPPERGACYRLDVTEALAPTNDSRTVRCRRAHTSQTFRVGRLKLRAGDREIEVDSGRAQRQARDACTAGLGRFLEADAERLRLSTLTTVWFTPTLEEAAAGGRWFRCDVIATVGGRRLLPLPRRVPGSLDAFALCATSEPGRPDSRRVPCSQPHAWRALATVDIPGAAYPSADRAADAMAGTCRDVARAAAPDPLDFTWSEERPTRAQWRTGQRYGICWAPE